MRYLVLLVLGMTVFFTHAQSVNKQSSEIATANPQSNGTANPSGENSLLGLPPVPIRQTIRKLPPKLNWEINSFMTNDFLSMAQSVARKCHDDKLAFTDVWSFRSVITD